MRAGSEPVRPVGARPAEPRRHRCRGPPAGAARGRAGADGRRAARPPCRAGRPPPDPPAAGARRHGRRARRACSSPWGSGCWCAPRGTETPTTTAAADKQAITLVQVTGADGTAAGCAIVGTTKGDGSAVALLVPSRLIVDVAGSGAMPFGETTTLRRPGRRPPRRSPTCSGVRVDDTLDADQAGAGRPRRRGRRRPGRGRRRRRRTPRRTAPRPSSSRRATSCSRAPRPRRLRHVPRGQRARGGPAGPLRRRADRAAGEAARRRDRHRRAPRDGRRRLVVQPRPGPAGRPAGRDARGGQEGRVRVRRAPGQRDRHRRPGAVVRPQRGQTRTPRCGRSSPGRCRRTPRAGWSASSWRTASAPRAWSRRRGPAGGRRVPVQERRQRVTVHEPAPARSR